MFISVLTLFILTNMISPSPKGWLDVDEQLVDATYDTLIRSNLYLALLGHNVGENGSLKLVPVSAEIDTLIECHLEPSELLQSESVTHILGPELYGSRSISSSFT
jgi:hypothetical protein